MKISTQNMALAILEASKNVKILKAGGKVECMREIAAAYDGNMTRFLMTE